MDWSSIIGATIGEIIGIVFICLIAYGLYKWIKGLKSAKKD